MTAYNLDRECAAAGRAVASAFGKSKDAEKLLPAALAVLREQGLYALHLYLRAEKQQNTWEKCRELLNKLLPPEDGAAAPNDEAFLQRLSENLDALLLAREILHKTFEYARYFAKAGSPAPDAEKEENAHDG